MMCKLKSLMDKGVPLRCGNEMVDGKGGIMMWKLKFQMDKGGHYDVQIKRADG